MERTGSTYIGLSQAVGYGSVRLYYHKGALYRQDCITGTVTRFDPPPSPPTTREEAWVQIREAIRRRRGALDRLADL